MNSPGIYFLIIIACIVSQAFFVMQEMACVSFNKVRLQYFLSIGSKRAKWLNALLLTPANLYGSVLILAYTALYLGSESARRLYESVGLAPDLAITQAIFVLIFAEMAPMFAARRHPEQIAMMGAPILFASSKILYPIIKLLEFLCILINKMVGVETKTAFYLSRDEIQKILEERDDVLQEGQNVEFNTVVSGIFSIKTRFAKDIMIPIAKCQLAPVNLPISALRQILERDYVAYIPVFLRNNHNVIGVVYPRDLILVDDQAIVKDHMRPAWFITENQSLLSILKQFRQNNQTVAVVLDKTGSASGILTLDALIDSIFAKSDDWNSLEPHGVGQVFLEKSFDADMEIAHFNEMYGLKLSCDGAKSLADIFTKQLGHIANKGDVVRIENFELIVQDSGLRGPKLILIRTKK